MAATDLEVHTCCFIGHREIHETETLKLQLLQSIEHFITDKQVDTFLFGSKSQFNQLCYDLVTKLKETYPHIRRIYVRAEFPHISDSYQTYLMERYEHTYYPEAILGAGKSIYVKRNNIMIDRSHFCVFYYQESYAPSGRNSGTRLALNYAKKHHKSIHLFPSAEI